MSKISLYLLLIVLIAFVFRLYQISSVPPSASLDEATIGWNAYSILNTGADEYGYKFPILLRAYDDWRPALYVYLVLPFVKLLGLGILSVRLPSVILGTISVLGTYFLIMELFIKYKYRDYLALLSSFFLAISPWSIYISRLGHEANAGFAFGILSVFFFLKFKNTLGRINIYLASLFFALSFYAYQSEKIFIPSIVILLALLFRRELLKRKKDIIFAFILGFIILIPVLKETLSPNGLIRLKGTTAFDITRAEYVQAATERLKARNDKNFIAELINNNRIITSEIFIGNYISHFNPLWLFSNYGLEDFKVPGMGLMFLFEIPLMLIGIAYLFFGNFDKKIKILIGVWILISPVASSISTGAPQAMRFYIVLPTFQIISSLGLLYLISLAKKDSTRKTIFSLTIGVMVSSIVFLINQYFIEFPKQNSSSFQYAISNAMGFIIKNEDKYKKIVISNRKNLNQSYMFLLFYSKYDPILYQKQGGTKSAGFEATHRFSNFEFRALNWSNDKYAKNTLFIANTSSIPKGEKALKIFANLNNQGVIEVIWKK